MANQPVYECSNCTSSPGRELLTVKKVMFVEMGVGGRTLRSRVTGWLCPECVARDPDYKREAFQAPNIHRAGSVKSDLIG